ncbi:MAG: hypothetical protein JXN65_01500 [Clostridia bacterium]|nr:hypothetical protein [Clostridia bacterium]
MKKLFLAIIILTIILTSIPSCWQAKNIEVHYITVTRAYDWGAAIDKIILCFDTEIDAASFDNSTFKVKSVRTYVENNKKKSITAKRTITKTYLCDSQGNPTITGNCIAIEMAVGPTVIESSPYNYNTSKFLNEVVETGYIISLAYSKTISSSDGKTLTFSKTGEAEKAGDIKIIADDFVNNQKFSFGDVDMTYAYYSPDTSLASEGSVPLIVWLHGGGEGGTDTTVPLMANKVVNLATETCQSYFGDTGAYVLVPQVPTMWVDTNGSGEYGFSPAGESYYTEALKALIDKFVVDNSFVDGNKIIVGGCSAGGFMTINMLINYTDYFAAGFPICAAYKKGWMYQQRIEAIKDMPIWIVHALTDATFPIARGEFDRKNNVYIVYQKADGSPQLIDDFSNEFYRRLVEAGGQNVHYSRLDKVVDTSGLYTNSDGTPYEYLGHFSWIYALNNECVLTIDGKETTLFEWLSMQERN